MECCVSFWARMSCTPSPFFLHKRKILQKKEIYVGVSYQIYLPDSFASPISFRTDILHWKKYQCWNEWKKLNRKNTYWKIYSRLQKYVLNIPKVKLFHYPSFSLKLVTGYVNNLLWSSHIPSRQSIWYLFWAQKRAKKLSGSNMHSKQQSCNVENKYDFQFNFCHPFSCDCPIHRQNPVHDTSFLPTRPHK